MKPNYVYLLQEREFIKTKENIYKIGKTKQPNNKRFPQYPKGSVLLFQIVCSDCTETENKIMSSFKDTFKQRLDIGREYFEGDYTKMIGEIYIIAIKNPDNIKETIKESVLITATNALSTKLTETIQINKAAIVPAKQITFSQQINITQKTNNVSPVTIHKFLQQSIDKKSNYHHYMVKKANLGNSYVYTVLDTYNYAFNDTGFPGEKCGTIVLYDIHVKTELINFIITCAFGNSRVCTFRDLSYSLSGDKLYIEYMAYPYSIRKPVKERLIVVHCDISLAEVAQKECASLGYKHIIICVSGGIEYSSSREY